MKPEDGLKLSPYPELTTPQNTLEALRLAYEHRDSVETARVYDDAYEGVSQDLDPQNPNPIYFSKSNEVRHVGALFLTHSISSVSLDMGSSSSWSRLPSADASHPDWAVIPIAYHNIRVVDGYTEWQSAGSYTFNFTFAPTPDSTSATDTLWKVVRWQEIFSGP